MSFQRPYNPDPPKNCYECGFFKICGGLDGDEINKGCFNRCITHCQHDWCDLACPSLPLNFPNFIEDVEGLCVPPRDKLRPCGLDEMPFYIPQIHHGSHRVEKLEEQIAVIPLTSVLRKTKKGYQCSFPSASELRSKLKLSANTKILVSSISEDQPIEDFWADHVKNDILSQLKTLQLAGMTTPNFSFIKNAPRINALYNMTRIFRIAERINGAGIGTILHLQASTKADWKKWEAIIKDQPYVKHIAAEFQTGTRSQIIGDNYYAGLVDMQQKIGRDLHPVFFAGRGKIPQLIRDFKSFTIVDSNAFLKTVKRQKLVQISQGQWTWRQNLTKPKEALDWLLQHNIKTEKERMLEKINSSRTGRLTFFSTAA